jgi:uncharacterized protein (DUF427 family)
MGDDFTLSGKPTILEVKLAKHGMIRVIKNGAVIAENAKRGMQLDVTEPGVYRIEVQQQMFGFKKPWIFSNPIFVRG